MQGSIAFDGTLSGSIAGGGGGGSEVSITPTLTEGTKIADYEIDGTPGELYAPTPSVVPEHIVTDIHGFSYTPYPSTEVARYTIDDGEEQSIRTPDYTTTWEAYPGVAQDYTIGILRCYGSNYNVKIPYFQRPLTAGANITIDADNVISASGGSGIDYSLTEHDTGIKWVDGKTIYQRTFSVNLALTAEAWTNTGINIPNAICVGVECLQYEPDGTCVFCNGNIDSNNVLNLYNLRNTDINVNYVTVRYVKTA